MSKLNIPKVLSTAKVFTNRYTPEILTGIGIAGMLTTTILAVKVTPKAVRLMNDKKDELEVEKLPAVEVVKTTWKCYIPAAVTGVASVACLIGANSVSNKRMAALTAAYKISETAFTEYQQKVVETRDVDILVSAAAGSGKTAVLSSQHSLIMSIVAVATILWH